MKKGMKAEEERARFCDSCNAVIGWYASYCDECGMRLGETVTESAPTGAPAERTSPSLERDLFQAHLRLIHRFREQSENLKKECRRVERVIKTVEVDPKRPENVRKLVGMAERLLDLEHDWEDLQHQYNRQSESLEEDFLARGSELSADLELAPEHQLAVEEEVRLFAVSLEEAETDLRETGRFLDVVRGRQTSRVLGIGGTKGTTLVFCVALAFTLGGGAHGVFRLGIDPVDMAVVLGPAVVGLIVLYWHARRSGPWAG
jgi:hypothetical protein